MTKISRKMDGLHPRPACTRQGRSAGIILAILSVLFLLGTGAAHRAQAQTVIVLHSFAGSDGLSPIAGLVRDSSGNLYGTTYSGGTSNNCPGGCGTVFKLDSSGTLTILHSFSGSDGKFPIAGLLADSSGNLYGTTRFGGIVNSDCQVGCGTVYKLDTSGGGFALLHSFSGGDGQYPAAGLLLDSSGNLYGTTETGGSSGHGTVFKLDTSLTLNVLHNFAGYPSEGADPESTLLLDSSGNLYGTTYFGGSYFLGTVYKLDTSGGGFAVLHDFAYTEGALLWSGLVLDSSGNLYGTTLYSCTSTYCSSSGTVFKLDTSGGGFAVLHSFSGSDGEEPIGGLVLDSAGNLYGTTVLGGSYGHGAAFKLDTSNTLTVLYNFAEYLGDADGPESTLVMDSSGNFYGTTYTGGSYGYGTVFEISMTPQGGAQAITTQVNGLLAQGVINNGQDNSLVKTLQHAIKMMNAGKINGAIGNLEDFISEVNDLYNSGVLTEAQWNQLISAANGIIAQLQAM